MAAAEGGGGCDAEKIEAAGAHAVGGDGKYAGGVRGGVRKGG